MINTISDYYRKIIQGFFGLLKWIILFLLHGRLFALAKHKEKNDDIFIIGNGPSLNSDIQNFIKNLKDSNLIMMNQAANNELFFILKPKYYILCDPAYFGFYSKENQAHISNILLELRQSFEQVAWNMILFLPYHLYIKGDRTLFKHLNKNITIAPFNAIQAKTFSFIEKQLLLMGLSVSSTQTVAIPAICLAIAMGYKNIFTLGLDHNWHQQLEVDNDTNEVKYYTDHFYGKQQYKLQGDVHTEFQNIVEVFSAYKRLQRLGFSIYNLSSSSMLDVFPRKKLHNIFIKKDMDEKTS